MNRSEMPMNTITSHVHWNDDPGKVDVTSRPLNDHHHHHHQCSETNADNANKKGRPKEDDLRAKIHKAVQIELAYLDKAIEIGKKRKLMMRRLNETIERNQQEKSTTTISASSPQDSYTSTPQSLTEKIAYATRLEKIYFHKARQVHDRRYRWTKLYELSQTTKESLTSLPPLMTNLYAAEEKLSMA